MKTLVGITTYKRADMLFACLSSIAANTDRTDCIVVVHSNSTEQAYNRAVADMAHGLGIEVVGDGVNHGLACALNRLAGRERHTTDRIVLMNDDIKVYAGWLDAIHTTLGDLRMGLISLSLANGHAEWNHVNPDDVDPKRAALTRYYCTYPTGCLMAMRRDVYERVGPFDEQLWLRLEEVDYGIRAMRAGYRNANVGVSGEAYKFAAHYGSASGGGSYGEHDMSPEQIAMARQSDAHFERKHGVGFPLPQAFERALAQELGPC